MRHLITKENPNNKYEIAIVIKSGSFNVDAIKRHYINPLIEAGINEEDIIVFTLDYNEANKAPIKLQKECLETLGKGLAILKTKHLLITDGAYFKTICGVKKADAYYGHILKGHYERFTEIDCILSVNQSALFYTPTLKDKLVHSLKILVANIGGEVILEPGHDVFHNVTYPETPQEIIKALMSLLTHPELAIDIEGFSLRFNEAKIATISFAWSEHDGIAFDVQHTRTEDIDKIYAYLHTFFLSYRGNIIMHNCAYDAQVIIYELFMRKYLHTYGLYNGLKCLFRNLDDTKILTYLATNSAVGNKLDLKSNVQEYLGSYAIDDINDITKVPIEELLPYNMADSLGTFWLKKKMMPKVIADDQLSVYQEIMQPSMRTICQMQLTGMPLNMDRVLEVQKELIIIHDKYAELIKSSPIITNFRVIEMHLLMEIANKKLKKKVKPLSDFEDYEFNANSNQQVARLLHGYLELPVIDRTAKGYPSVGGDTLKKHLLATTTSEQKELIEALIELTAVNKILNTFISAFINYSVLKEDGIYWLHGNFNLGGTVSGRLSSSNPNLQNIPSNSLYGKLIKSCFMAPPDWIMAGADFNSLEDMISALTTKDPNKLKVYTDGYDGHSLRAYSYFSSAMHGINGSVASINSIADLYPKLRQDSKGPTFALTYGGTAYALEYQCGIPRSEAISIETKYHALYEVSDDYVTERLSRACDEGYVTVAFGLRVRTPVLKQVILNNGATPFAGSAEGRTAGNALGQSYGQLTNRAANDFMNKVANSKYKYDIKIIAQIHDAIYLLFKNTIGCVAFINRELIHAMSWQELPEIKHDTVKLGAGLELYPDWSKPVKIPNNISQQEILNICETYVPPD